MKFAWQLMAMCGMLVYSNAIENVSYAPKALYILADASEKGLGPITYTFLSLLYKEVAPVLVSTSLVRNVFSEDYRRSKDVYLGRDSILLAKSRFNHGEWIVKKINADLFLFIPHAYLRKKKIAIDAVKKDGLLIDAGVSPIEIELGLKVNHMKTLDKQAFAKDMSGQYATFLVAHSSDFLKSVFDEQLKRSQVFCMRSDYFMKNVPRPLWAFFLDGHGNVEELISGFVLDDFKRLLNFFENYINCRLFIYNSCFSAGIKEKKFMVI